MPTRTRTFARSAAGHRHAGLSNRLVQVVDACLAGVVLFAPYFLGGRHPIGQFVFVVLAVVMAAAWCWRQWLEGSSSYRFSGVELLLIAAVLVVAVQIIPLPAGVLDAISPATKSVLATDGAAGQSTAWSTISLAPSLSRDALAVLIAHALVLLVVIQRVRTLGDIQRVLWLLAGAAVLMALVGLAQYALGNGRFMWVYDHPFRSTEGGIKGSFINRNHFTQFLALGIGPLVWCMVAGGRKTSHGEMDGTEGIHPLLEKLGFVPVAIGLAIVLFAGLCSLSRGGAIAMATALCLSSLLMWRAGAISLRFVGILAAVAVLLGGTLMLHGTEQIQSRLDDLTEGSVDRLDNAQARRRLWEANWKAYGNYRALGTGAGTHAEVYPLYISQHFPKEFTHAESGYFQLASTTGSAGLAVLLAGLLFGGAIVIRTATTAKDRRYLACLAAVAGSLAASAVHSVADFVWFIPACMSMTVIAAGCVVRIWMLARPQGDRAVHVSKMAWGAATIAVVVGGGALILFQWHAAHASVAWDAYVRDDVALQQLSKTQAEWSPTELAAGVNQRRASMLRHLQTVVTRDPNDGRAHLRLAGASLLRFEECQQQSANAMTLSQICDAAMASRFASRQELDAWLARALGENAQYLHAALWHTRRGLSLVPLQGEGYVFLAQLCFLEGGDATRRSELMALALKLRPHSESVLIAAAEEAWLRGDQQAMLDYGKKAFHLGGRYRPVLIQTWAGRFPVATLLTQLEPELDDWWELFSAYRKLADANELRVLCQYYATLAEQHPADFQGYPAAVMWSNIGNIRLMHKETAAAAECARRALRCDGDNRNIRINGAVLLSAAQQWDEAEPHIRWCLQRMPDHAGLQKLAKQAAEARLSGQERIATGPESDRRK